MQYVLLVLRSNTPTNQAPESSRFSEYQDEAVERPPKQVEIAVRAPILRLTVLNPLDTSEFRDVDTPGLFFDTLSNGVCSEDKKLSAAFRPHVLQMSRSVIPCILTISHFLREVVIVLFQRMVGIEVCLFGAVRDLRRCRSRGRYPLSRVQTREWSQFRLCGSIESTDCVGVSRQND